MDVSAGLSLVQFVIEKLGSPIWNQIEGVLGLECQLDKLKETMSTIEAVLRDAEEQEHEQYRFTHVERNKLRRLKDALYRADDLVDEIVTLANLKKLMPCNSNRVCNEVCLFFSRHNQFRSASTWSQEMEKILEMLDDIVKDHRYELASRPSAGVDAKQMRISERETHSFLDEEDKIIGREDDEREVIEKLLNNNNNTSVEQQDGFVVSIVGIGGLGKTSLAKKVYRDGMIEKKFPQKLWVCVSEDFNIKTILGSILEAANQGFKKDNNLSMEELQKKLRRELDGKKYLLVLDDVWNEDSNKWFELISVLIGGGRVSSIIVTTRSKTVADVVGRHCPHWTHELKGLSEDASLELFTKMALEPEKYPVKTELVDIAKVIVRKCAYVPLAIRVVGSLLRGQDESKWENLKNTDLANIVQDETNGILPVLKISYNYFPFHLKSCFSYCAIFPKDYKIIKEDLICLWMAQGFIIPSDGESLEDVGGKYFEQLLQRCFFQDVQVAEGTSEVISCKMHDLIHDLAKEVAGTDILSCTYKASCFNERTRHVYLDRSTPEDLLGELTNMGRMRTLLCNDYHKLPSSFRSLVVEVSKVKYLRVLGLKYGCLKMLPNGIGELVHLRYLDLSNNWDLCLLPSSITELYNLETLKLCDCWNLKRLPREMRKLVNLRHLDISGCRRLTHMPPGMNDMSLQKLTMFVVSGSGRSNAAWNWRSTDVGQLEDLDGFINHSHTMKIIVKEGVRYNAMKRGGRMLSKSQELWEIIYKWETKEYYNAEELLQGLQPHSNLRKLELWYYPGVMFPKWNLRNCLPNLVEIYIYSCERLKQLPLMSELLYLEVLELENLSEVEYVQNNKNNNNSGDEDGDELVFFPSLKKMMLRNMPKLKGWWMSKSESGLYEAPQARLNGTPVSPMSLKSCLPNLVEIKINGCEKLEHLPLMSQLLHLKVLELEDLSEVEYMENNNSGDDTGDELVFFPSLEKLKLAKMPKLKGLWKSKSESGQNETTPQAPNLSHLEISCCSNLTTLFPCPEINGALVSPMSLKSCLPNLVEIKINGCGKLEHLPLMSQLLHLKVLEIKYSSKVEYMENEDSNELVFFPSLENLKLWGMPKLKGLWKSKSESGQNETLQAPNLSHLEIYNCSNLTTLFPCPEINGALMCLKSCLPNLVEIKIYGCEKLGHLPLMSQLLHLKVIELEYLSEVEYIEDNNNSGDEDGDELVFFPSLEKLKLWKLPKLKGWWKNSSSESRKGETREAALLSELVIRDCPELTTFPLCPKLEKLKLDNYNEALGPIMRETTHDLSSSSSICNKQHQDEEGQHGGRLREVEIDNVAYLNSLPIHHLSHLVINNDNNIEILRIGEVGELFRSGRLSSLRSLEISFCSKLKSISGGRGVWEHYFTALENLSLRWLDELELEDEDDVSNSGSNESTGEGSSAAEMPWRYLAPTLRSLQLWSLPKVVKLPKGIGCLSSLHSLDIWECHNLESLTPSIGGLSSLQSLEIHGCPKLKTMPKEMRHLTSLTKLKIGRCSPELKKRCEKHTGIYWPYIQHIPHITVDANQDLNPSWKNCFGQ